MKDNGTTFDHSFLLAVYSIVNHEPERIAKLFTSKDERGYDMSFYDPVDRGRDATTWNFDMTRDWRGKEDVEAYRDHW